MKVWLRVDSVNGDSWRSCRRLALGSAFVNGGENMGRYLIMNEQALFMQSSVDTPELHEAVPLLYDGV